MPGGKLRKQDTITFPRGEAPMTARIYKPAKSAMQSGYGNTEEWLLEFDSEAKRMPDPLMGWSGSGDTQQQVRLSFATKEEAIAYATRNGIAYTLTEPKPRAPIKKSYADNFRYGRIGTWTH